MQADSHADTRRELLAKARLELDQGKLLQASEKVWGAAAHMVKAIAEGRGWPHDSERMERL